MLRSCWLLFVYISFLGVSLTAPFVATLGYVWVDTFQPQNVAYIVLNQLPVAMIMGVVAIGGYLLMDRRSPPPVTLQTALQVAMIIWVTLTLNWAVAPEAAWGKWDTAFKTLAFAAFLPYVIRSHAQIEAFAQTYVFSLAANFLPFGVKVLVSGGGYGSNLGLQGGNSGLSEGGLLSTVCLMTVPLAIFLSAHSQLIPKNKLLPLAYWAVAALAIITAIGTYERSALVGLVVLAGYMWMRTKHKFGFGLVVAAVGCILIYTASSQWNARISTISTDMQNEELAYVRILVWKWTLQFTSTHPFGGGFQSYIIDHVDIPGTGGQPAHMQFGRAFHSIYFEVLGEHGYPGIIIFLALAATTFITLRRLAKRARVYPELQWVVGLSDALQSGLAVFLTAGAFVGIAFQPMFWYFVSLAISLNAYMWRVEKAQVQPDADRRSVSTVRNAISTAQAEPLGWRHRRAQSASTTDLPRR